MSGILVGVDGSGHSDRALGWAAREAAIRQVPLTVLTVHQIMRGYYSAVPYPQDESLARCPSMNAPPRASWSSSCTPTTWR